MTAKRIAKTGKPPNGQASHAEDGELVILTGMSGSGKESALKAFEDLGYYSVDNLPLELVPRFADLVSQSAEIERAALVVEDSEPGMASGRAAGFEVLAVKGPADVQERVLGRLSRTSSVNTV